MTSTLGTRSLAALALADATLDVVDRHDDEPFFVMTSSYAVHTPVGKAQARKDLLTKSDLDRDALYWHLPGYLIDEARNQHPQSVIRSRQWS